MSHAESELEPSTLKALEQTDLCYADTHEPGFSRKGAGTGFAFYNIDGDLIPDSPTRQRLTDLAIPPAWTEVWIAPRADHHIQATGRDEAGRKQYIYHDDWAEARARMNFNRLQGFGQALPGLRNAVYRRLRTTRPDRETVIAAVVRLLDSTLIRVGNLNYARENDSYGLTTLEREHVSLEDNDILLSFTGKSGVERELSLHDPLLSELIDELEEGHGDRVFRYRAGGDDWQPVTATAVNEFLNTHAGDFTAKDFRPWGGSVTLTDALGQFTEETEPTQRHLHEAIRLAAARLGNTPSVAKAHYLHPSIGEVFLQGRLSGYMEQGRSVAEQNNRLKLAEGTLLAILEDAA